jgi:hypothetical protein
VLLTRFRLPFLRIVCGHLSQVAIHVRAKLKLGLVDSGRRDEQSLWIVRDNTLTVYHPKLYKAGLVAIKQEIVEA